MGTFKLQVPSAKLMFTHVFNTGSRRLFAWNARAPRLSAPNVIESSRRFEARAIDSALVTDFRAKLRQTEYLIGKLGYSLREITREGHN